MRGELAPSGAYLARVWGLGFGVSVRVSGFGFRVQGSGSRVYGLELSVQGLGLRVWA